MENSNASLVEFVKNNAAEIEALEKMFGTISSRYIQEAKSLREDLGMDWDLIIAIWDHCVAKGKASAVYVCKFSRIVHEKGVTTKEQFYEYLASLDEPREKKSHKNPADYIIDRERVLHMHGVAEYMYRNAGRFEGLDPEKMYLLGYLHDIGYISGDKNGHELYGALLLAKCFSTNFGMPFLGDLINHHGDTPSGWLKNHDIVPDELRLLWEADMMVDLTGECVGYEKRLEGIARTSGTSSESYRICRETIDWLKSQR